MGDLSKNFDRSEFACKCGCGYDTVDIALVHALEDAREHFNSPISINSGARCRAHNTEVTKRPTSKSQHLYGKASDFTVAGVHPDDVAEYLEYIYKTQYGIGRYKGRTHLDVRTGKARWDKR